MDAGLKEQMDLLREAEALALEGCEIASEMVKKLRKATSHTGGAWLHNHFLLHLNLNSASGMGEELKKKLDKFYALLAGVKLDGDFDFREEGFETFRDWFMDGLVFDVPYFVISEVGRDKKVQGVDRMSATMHNLMVAAERLQEVRAWIAETEQEGDHETV